MHFFHKKVHFFIAYDNFWQFEVVPLHRQIKKTSINTIILQLCNWNLTSTHKTYKLPQRHSSTISTAFSSVCKLYQTTNNIHS